MLLRNARAVLRDHDGDESDQQPLQRDGGDPANATAKETCLARPQRDGTDYGEQHPQVADGPQDLRGGMEVRRDDPAPARGARGGEAGQRGLAVRTVSVSGRAIGDGHSSSRKVMSDDAPRTVSSATPWAVPKAGAR